ncbi:MAG TPA: hypothetical protein VFV33_12395, partial [Gemmatimonadaceae bacterium]|nr:hypothetical protein [Gemmatimonadaceae bacterium]
VEVSIDLVPEMPHNSPLIADFHPAARAAVDRLVAWVETRLAPDGQVGASVPAAVSARVPARG